MSYYNIYVKHLILNDQLDYAIVYSDGMNVDPKVFIGSKDIVLKKLAFIITHRVDENIESVIKDGLNEDDFDLENDGVYIYLAEHGYSFKDLISLPLLKTEIKTNDYTFKVFNEQFQKVITNHIADYFKINPWEHIFWRFEVDGASVTLGKVNLH